jgi:hypothetical protein
VKLWLLLLLVALPLSGCVKCYYWAGPYEATLPPGGETTEPPEATPPP